ncbi:MAG: [NiFe]-hydrogenase assembly chaperone HybE [Comamonadaceae bacterium]
MSLRIHQHNPAELVEQTYFRIQQERMVDVPILNPALSVEAIDFQRWQGHWLGVVLTPWCMSLLLVPGSSENWESTGENKRRFVKFPAGEFAFLGSVEAELGEYQSCALFSPMDQFNAQSQASMTARASLSGLLSAPGAAREEKPAGKPSLSRRRFFAMR